MTILPQMNLFGESESGDLERLERVLGVLDDGKHKGIGVKLENVRYESILASSRSARITRKYLKSPPIKKCTYCSRARSATFLIDLSSVY